MFFARNRVQWTITTEHQFVPLPKHVNVRQFNSKTTTTNYSSSCCCCRVFFTVVNPYHLSRSAHTPRYNFAYSLAHKVNRLLWCCFYYLLFSRRECRCSLSLPQRIKFNRAQAILIACCNIFSFIRAVYCYRFDVSCMDARLCQHKNKIEK